MPSFADCEMDERAEADLTKANGSLQFVDAPIKVEDVEADRDYTRQEREQALELGLRRHIETMPLDNIALQMLTPSMDDGGSISPRFGSGCEQNNDYGGCVGGPQIVQDLERTFRVTMNLPKTKFSQWLSK